MAGYRGPWSSRLQEDLAEGPVFYRRVPGGNRSYYDPKRPTRPAVTEHYVVRIYKPAIQQEQRALINARVQQYQRIARAEDKSLATTYIKRQAALGQPVTTQNLTLKDAQFKDLVRRMRIASYNARAQNELTNPTRARAFETGSTYSDLLVALGRRTGEEDFPIGESPKHSEAGGTYIDTVVVPYLTQGVQVNVERESNIELLSGAGIDASNFSDRQIRIALDREGLI